MKHKRWLTPVAAITRIALPLLVISFALFVTDAPAAVKLGAYSVMAAGAKANGTDDDTAAIQRALDEAGTTDGRVLLPPTRLLVKGSLRIPPGVTLQGTMESPVWSEPLKGSVVLATGGRGQEDGLALFELGHYHGKQLCARRADSK